MLARTMHADVGIGACKHASYSPTLRPDRRLATSSPPEQPPRAQAENDPQRGERLSRVDLRRAPLAVDEDDRRLGESGTGASQMPKDLFLEGIAPAADRLVIHPGSKVLRP